MFVNVYMGFTPNISAQSVNTFQEIGLSLMVVSIDKIKKNQHIPLFLWPRFVSARIDIINHVWLFIDP